MTPISRRRLLRSLALGVTIAPLASLPLRAAFGAAGPLLSPAEPAAKAVRYVEDARQAKGATAGSTCANCALYLGATGAAQGPCQIFAGKQVKAAGWCSSWAPQM
jgi:high potential iron-sulfur protein